ncbi:hypothetical protein, partial [Escherichia albertii]|uniref:hypothetical protein n=1 Tax=Escherichia albertii TaxID=208962 RepID=UPI001EDA096E
KNDGHYFCGAGGNRPDGSDEALTKVTNIGENDEKYNKQITCCNDRKSTVARKEKSPALQRGLMNLVPDSESYPRLTCCLLLVLLVFLSNSAPTKAPI